MAAYGEPPQYWNGNSEVQLKDEPSNYRIATQSESIRKGVDSDSDVLVRLGGDGDGDDDVAL